MNGRSRLIGLASAIFLAQHVTFNIPYSLISIFDEPKFPQKCYQQLPTSVIDMVIKMKIFSQRLVQASHFPGLRSLKCTCRTLGLNHEGLSYANLLTEESLLGLEKKLCAQLVGFDP
jgi:hypothetical protein